MHGPRNYHTKRSKSEKDEYPKKSEIEPNLERIRDVLGLDDDFPLLLYSCTAKIGRRELLGFIENNI